MEPFWVFSASLLPKWLSPNFVTMGTAFFLFSGVVVAYFLDNKMVQSIPSWAHLYFAFSIFMAQTLDAIDGKHARNTGRSSPLGQLMDHGADAFCNCFSTCMVSASFGFGDSFISIIVLIYGQSLFWVINWEEYLTGTLRTQVDGVGGTEIQFMGMFMLIWPVIDPFEIYNYKILGLISVIHVFLYYTIFFGLYNMLYKIFVNCLAKLRSEGKEDKRTKGIEMSLCPLLIFLGEMMFYKTEIFNKHTIELSVMGGVVFGFYMSKVIIATMSHRDMEIFDLDSLLFFALQITANFFITSYKFQLFLYLAFGIFVSLRYSHYIISILFQLLRKLNISF